MSAGGRARVPLFLPSASAKAQSRLSQKNVPGRRRSKRASSPRRGRRADGRGRAGGRTQPKSLTLTEMLISLSTHYTT